MVKTHAVEGYTKYQEVLQEIKEHGDNEGNIFLFFSGTKNEDGESWCPDCVRAMPVVEQALSETNAKDHFIYVGVGTRDMWKDPNNSFRKDPKLRLKSVPTLIAWGKPDRLEDKDCCNYELLKMVFKPDD